MPLRRPSGRAGGGGDEAMLVMAFALGGVALAVNAVMVGIRRALRG